MCMIDEAIKEILIMAIALYSTFGVQFLMCMVQPTENC
jgi:hypothetical protein